MSSPAERGGPRPRPSSGDASAAGRAVRPASASASLSASARQAEYASSNGGRTSSSYEDRMREKLRRADENRASHLARASVSGGAAGSAAAASSVSGAASVASASSRGSRSAAALSSKQRGGEARASVGAGGDPRRPTDRASRFWAKAESSGVLDEVRGSAEVGEYAADADDPDGESVHEPDSAHGPDEGDGHGDRHDRDREEVHAEVGLRDGEEVRAEVGLRLGDAEGAALAAAGGGGGPGAPSWGARDYVAAVRAKQAASAAGTAAASHGGGGSGPPGGYHAEPADPLQRGPDGEPQPQLQRKASQDSMESGNASLSGVPRAHSVATESGHFGHQYHDSYGHGSGLGHVGLGDQVSPGEGEGEGGFVDESGNRVVYDQNNNPMVVAQAVKAESSRDVRRGDDFQDNAGGVAAGSAAGGGDGDHRPSLAVATKDTFKEHLLRSRRTQCGLAALVAVVAGLAVGLGVALKPGGVDGGGRMEEDDFWDPDPPAVDGTDDKGDFGATVSMDASGTLLAVGSPGVLDAIEGDGDFLRRGKVEVRRRNPATGEWEPLGPTILPAALDGRDDILLPNVGVRNLIKVALSGDGHTLAVGSSFHDRSDADGGGVRNAGQVEVYRLSDAADEWLLQGDPIVGEEEDDYLGASLDLSEDGLTLAVGIPGRSAEENGVVVERAGAARMFFFNDNEWLRLGSRGAVGRSAGEMMGGSVSLSSDGRRVAVGSSARKGGQSGGSTATVAKVFRFVGGDWDEVGNGVDGGEGLYDTAYDAALSADGTRIVVSNHYVGENGPKIQSGVANNDLFVAAYGYDPSADEWVVIGENLHISSVGDKSGYFISLSDDGNIIGMGDPGRSVSGGRIAGHAHIYAYDPGRGEFRQVGPNIDGEAAGDMFGYEVALSGDGMRYAVGAPSSRKNGFTHGRVQIFDVPVV